jgi:hypothetical protein
MVTVGGIINGGIGLVRERPLAILVWGLLYMAAFLGMMASVFVPFMQLIVANAATPNSVDPTRMLAMMGEIYLIDFLMLIMFTVLLAAGLRAALRPQERSFASLRLGMDELRLVGLSLLLMIGFVVIVMVVGIVMTIVMIAVGVAAGSGGQMGASGFAGIGIGMAVMMVVSYGLPIFFAVRLSPAFALTMLRRKIVVGEAWRLTRGNFWTLFGGYLVLGLISMAAYMVILIVLIIPATSMGGGLPGLAGALQQGQISGTLMTIMVIGGALFSLLAGASIALWAGGIGGATNGLLGTTNIDYAETFA